MKRKILSLCLLATLLLVNPPVSADPELAIIEDIKIDLIKASPEIKIASSVPIEYLDYTLESPPRIIVDPLGSVYSNLDEEIFRGTNLVQKVTLVKVRGDLPRGLDRSYYPLDFIIIELDRNVNYDVLRKEKLVVRLGKEIVPVEPVVVERPYVIERAEDEYEEEIEYYDEADVEIIEVDMADYEEEVIEVIEPGEEFFDEEKYPLVERYRIEPGDELEISIWQHPDLLRKVVVRPDGYISFPLAGEINVNGLTTDKVAKDVAIRTSRVLRKPEVSVIVTSFASKSIFILGAVNSPGIYPYKTNISVLKAVGLADSWKPHAYISSVLVVKKFFTGEADVIRVNLWDIVKHGQVRKDIKLEPGDIVYVPQSFIGNVGTFIEGLRGSLSAGAHYAID